MKKIEAMEIVQPIGKFYICKLKSDDIFELAKVDRIQISDDNDMLYEGIQRKIVRKKVEKISKYLRSNDATFPNSIILNLDRKYFKGYKDGYLMLDENENAFTIIDGQHRIEGLKESNIKDFELVLSIFVGLEVKDQSRIFVTINTEQTKIDPSLGLYQELHDDIYTPRKMAVHIAELFSMDSDSPWKRMIKLVGQKDELSEDGILSLKAFVTPLLDMVYDDDQYNELRNLLIESSSDFSKIKKGILWDMYEYKKENMLYKILLNFFLAVKDVLRNDWGNKGSLLNKTTGYTGMMYLFADLYKIGLNKGDLSYEFFKNQLKPLEEFNGRVNTTEFSPSGYHAAKELYTIFRQCIGLKNS